MFSLLFFFFVLVLCFFFCKSRVEEYYTQRKRCQLTRWRVDQHSSSVRSLIAAADALFGLDNCNCWFHNIHTHKTPPHTRNDFNVVWWWWMLLLFDRFSFPSEAPNFANKSFHMVREIEMYLYGNGRRRLVFCLWDFFSGCWREWVTEGIRWDFSVFCVLWE